MAIPRKRSSVDELVVVGAWTLAYPRKRPSTRSRTTIRMTCGTQQTIVVTYGDRDHNPEPEAD